MTFNLLGGADDVTARGDEVMVYDVRRASRSRTRDAIRRRLLDMNAQFDAIHEMSHNMEEEFSNTRLVSLFVLYLVNALLLQKEVIQQSKKC